MSAFHEIPANITNMSFWANEIDRNCEYACKLSKYQLTELKTFLNKNVIQEKLLLAKVKAANRGEEMSFPSIDSMSNVLGTVNARLLELEHTETFIKKTPAQRRISGARGGLKKKSPALKEIEQIKDLIKDKAHLSPTQIMNLTEGKGIVNPADGLPFSLSWFKKRRKLGDF